VMSKVLQDSDYEISQSYQQDILNNTVCHPTAVQYPPSSSYSKLFLKTLISKIEESGQEVQEDLYTTYTDLLSCNEGDIDSCYKTYCFGENVSVTLKETKKMVVGGTTGMLTWEAGCFLTEWCLRNSQLFAGKRILELGAGLGLLGLGVIKQCNPESYIFSDRHHGVLDALASNLELSISDEAPIEVQRDWRDGTEWRLNNTVVKIMELDWEKKVCPKDIDIILAADVVFSNKLTPSLVGVIEAVLKNERAQAYIASTRRNPETLEFFKEQLDMHGIDIEWTEEIKDYSSPHLILATIVLMRLSKRID
ncbi:unnamed protein product, partial [Meganyctiphanes norvegica]